MVYVCNITCTCYNGVLGPLLRQVTGNLEAPGPLLRRNERTNWTRVSCGINLPAHNPLLPRGGRSRASRAFILSLSLSILLLELEAEAVAKVPAVGLVCEAQQPVVGLVRVGASGVRAGRGAAAHARRLRP